MLKRFFDIFFCLLSLVLLTPLLLLIYLLIKFTSKGSILFKQKRIGKDNKEFTLYKFRTMKIETPNVATELLKDPEHYITPIGKFLRRSSLDELPQLFNILKGDMSIVGPRPALYNQYNLIELRTVNGIYRLVPGLTGWAQVNGRDVLIDNQKVAFDKYYLENICLWLDLKIIFLTIFKVLKSENVIEGGIQSFK